MIPHALIDQIISSYNYDPWNMMGPRNRFVRQNFMTVLTGTKHPVARCGVTAISKTITELYALTPTCIASFHRLIDKNSKELSQLAAQIELVETRIRKLRNITGLQRCSITGINERLPKLEALTSDIEQEITKLYQLHSTSTPPLDNILARIRKLEEHESSAGAARANLGKQVNEQRQDIDALRKECVSLRVEEALYGDELRPGPFKRDEPVMVRTNANDRWWPRYYSHWKRPFHYTYPGGQTSFTADTDVVPWADIRRPTPEELKGSNEC